MIVYFNKKVVFLQSNSKAIDRLLASQHDESPAYRGFESLQLLCYFIFFMAIVFLLSITPAVMKKMPFVFVPFIFSFR